MKKILFITIIIGSIFGSVMADEIKKRPLTLKDQVNEMRAEVPKRFACMISNMKSDFPNDKNTQLFILKMQVEAFWQIRENNFPRQIIVKAFEDFPCDFNTALFQIKMDMTASNQMNDLLGGN